MLPEHIGAALHVFGGLVHLGCGALLLLIRWADKRPASKQRTTPRGGARQPLRVLPGGRSTNGGAHG